MAMWSFIKSRGTDIGHVDSDQAMVQALQAEIARHGFDLGALTLTVEGETATLAGKTRDHDAREKIILIIGNVRGIAAVHDYVSGPVDPHFYTVVPGDTLPEIARVTLGDASRYREVYEANVPMMRSPDALYFGQVLRIPRR